MDCITASMKVYQNALDVRRMSFGGKIKTQSVSPVMIKKKAVPSSCFTELF